MIVVDSSAFIEFYRPGGRADVRHAVSEVIADDMVAVNGIIQTEVVTFAKGESAYEQLKQDFQAFHWLDLNKAVLNSRRQLQRAVVIKLNPTLYIFKQINQVRTDLIWVTTDIKFSQAIATSPGPNITK